MATESNDPKLDAQHRAPKRKWSTPIVIQSDTSDTNVSPFNVTSQIDLVYGPNRFGTAS